MKSIYILINKCTYFKFDTQKTAYLVSKAYAYAIMLASRASASPPGRRFAVADVSLQLQIVRTSRVGFPWLARLNNPHGSPNIPAFPL